MAVLDRLRDKAHSSMLASGARVRIGDPPSETNERNWQRKAYDYYDKHGQVRDAMRYLATGCSKVDIVPQELGDDGVTWEDTTNPAVLEQLHRVQTPTGGIESLLSMYAMQQSIAGESRILVTKAEDGGELWESLSPLELRILPGGQLQRRKVRLGQVESYKLADDDAEWEDTPDSAALHRLIDPHPAFSEEPDAPMHALLEDCEELLLLKRKVRSEVTSRIARAGIFLMPSEATFPGLPDCPPDDPNCDPLMMMLAQAATAAIKDEGSASAMLPIIGRVPAELTGAFHHYTFNAAMDAGYPEIALRTEVINRIAAGLPVPPEIARGEMGSQNHWNVWMIDEQAWKAYMQPVVERFCQDWTQIIMRPNLQADPERFRFWYDESRLVVRPNRSQDALEAFDRGGLTWAAMLEALAFRPGADGDEPTPEQRQEIADFFATKRGGAAFTPAAAQLGGEMHDPPTQNGAGNDNAAMMLGASRAAVGRCRALAGARLRNKATGTKYEPMIATTEDRLIASTIGDSGIADLGFGGDLGRHRLVSGGSACLDDVFDEYGIPQDDRLRICVEVEHAAAKTLLDTKPQVPGAVWTPTE